MSNLNLSENIILTEYQKDDIYRWLLLGEISICDIHHNLKMQLIRYLEAKVSEANIEINNLCICNPESTIEYWQKRHMGYVWPKRVLDMLIQNFLPAQQTVTKTDKLKVNQIALIHVYEGLQITRENAGEIAAKYGYTAKNSGEGLFQDYTNYCSTANRKGRPTPCTLKRLKNKIVLFESVVSHLSDNNKQRAIDEINILRTMFENDYQ